MNKILLFIGSLVMTLLIMSVPVLCGLAFGYNWNNAIKFVFAFLTFIFGCLLCEIIYLRAD